MPAPDADQYPADRGWTLQLHPELAVSREQVEANFRAYGLLDERVHFLEGWFKDTLPNAPIAQLAVLRLDGDLYQSTIQVMNMMYAKLSVGGFPDRGRLRIPPCRAAVEDFRRSHAINDPIVEIGGMGVYWRKSTHAPTPLAAYSEERQHQADTIAGRCNQCTLLYSKISKSPLKSSLIRPIDREFIRFT